MTLKTAFEISPKLGWVNLLVMVLLAVESCCMDMNFGGVTPGKDRSSPISRGGEPRYNAGDRSYILSKKNSVYGFLKTTPGSGHSTEVKPIVVPLSHSTEEPAEGTSSRATKMVIPDEGGIVHITRPKMAKFREQRRKMGLKISRWDDYKRRDRHVNHTPGGDEVSTKKNSLIIPEGGGPVYIDFPDYVKHHGSRKGKRNPEEKSISMIPADSEEVPNKGEQRRKDFSGSTRSDKETSESSLKQNSAEAVVTVEETVTRNGLTSILAPVFGKDEMISKGNIKSENMTQVPGEESSGVTSEPTVSSIYIGSSEYPFFAAVHAKGKGDVSFDDVQCSGGIVSEVAVVTSCSCLFADEWPSAPLVFYYVTVGHLKNANVNATPVYRVATIKYHPSCDKKETGLWKGNIAMLMIAKPGIQFGENVLPMNLPKLKMWDASDVLAKMSDQRRHCRVIGWSRQAPLIDAAIGKLIPLDECANPVCKNNMPCPERSTVDGFMVEITPNEPSLLPGALLYCSEHVFAIVNTKRQCATNHIFASCSPEELLYSKFNFDLTPDAQRDMAEYNNSFSNSIEGWETFTYPPALKKTSLPPNRIAFADIVSSGAVLLPFYVNREASCIYTYVFAAGYYVFLN